MDQETKKSMKDSLNLIREQEGIFLDKITTFQNKLLYQCVILNLKLIYIISYYNF